MKRSVLCRLQPKLGGLDRVLNALTHRGFLPESFHAIRRGDVLEVTFTIDCEDNKSYDKLVKFLDKQVYTLSVEALERPVPVLVRVPLQGHSPGMASRPETAV